MKSNTPHKVIIIDDHDIFNDGLALILKEKSTNYEVSHQVYDSREAINKCREIQPDLLLIDFNMPHLDGLEVVKAFKETMERQHAKIVILSMYSDNKHIKAFKSEGVDAYILKTTPVEELITILDEVMIGKSYFAGNHEKVSPKLKDDFGKKYFLTTQEKAILRCLKKGYTSVQMAEDMNLSPHTIKTHRKNIKQKLAFDTPGEFMDFLAQHEF